MGALLAAALMILVLWIIRKRAPGIVNRIFRRLQLVSGGFVAFTHGTNDAQKTMGIIALALVASGHLSPDFERPPLWVIVSSRRTGRSAGANRSASRIPSSALSFSEARTTSGGVNET